MGKCVGELRCSTPMRGVKIRKGSRVAEFHPGGGFRAAVGEEKEGGEIDMEEKKKGGKRKKEGRDERGKGARADSIVVVACESREFKEPVSTFCGGFAGKPATSDLDSSVGLREDSRVGQSAR